MSERAYLYLENPNDFRWIYRDRTGNNLAELAECISAQDIIIGIAGISLTTVRTLNLPPLSNRQQKFAVTTQLSSACLTAASELQFHALAKVSDTLPVAISNKKQLSACLQALAEKGVRLDYLIPVPAALMRTSDSWQCLVIDEICLISHGAEFIICDQSNLSEFIQIGTAGESAPVSITYYGCQPKASLSLSSALKVDIKVKDFIALRDDLSFMQLEQNSLLHGELQKFKRPAAKRLTDWANRLLIASLFLWLGVEVVATTHFTSKLHRLEHNIQAQDPNGALASTPVNKIHAQLSGQLKRLQSRNADQDLVQLLMKLDQALAKNSDIRVDTLDYQHEKLKLSFTATQYDEIVQFKQTLGRMGLQILGFVAHASEGKQVATLEVKRD